MEKGGDLNMEQFAQLLTFSNLVRKTFGCFDAENLSVPAEVQSLLDERAQARASKNFSESDRLRDAISALGYDVKDTSDGQMLRKR
jgi:cysteinyl-tRNA synthetase